MSKRRTVALIVRVTPEEKSAVTVAAERSHQTLSEWLRRAVVAKLKASEREHVAEQHGFEMSKAELEEHTLEVDSGDAGGDE